MLSSFIGPFLSYSIPSPSSPHFDSFPQLPPSFPFCIAFFFFSPLYFAPSPSLPSLFSPFLLSLFLLFYSFLFYIFFLLIIPIIIPFFFPCDQHHHFLFSSK